MTAIEQIEFWKMQQRVTYNYPLSAEKTYIEADGKRRITKEN